MTSRKDVVQEYFAAFNRRDFEAQKRLLAPNAAFEHHGDPIVGRDLLMGMLQGFCNAFPDLEFAVTDQIGLEDEVVAFLRASGTWQGEFFGMTPSGRHFTAQIVDRLRFSGECIARTTTVCEVLGTFSLMQQLGIAQQLSEAAKRSTV